ncbi:hypothetical protein MALG_05095 (plasmid) [Marinovum algicola DG 898]|nr:hypothetical protein MALG_05095 [Marinovum algicola DG 898]
MAKKSGVNLDGMIDPSARVRSTGIPQRGAEKPPKREGAKRLTLALDGDTYRRLRLHAAETDRTHQDILETALAEYLKNVKA